MKSLTKYLNERYSDGIGIDDIMGTNTHYGVDNEYSEHYISYDNRSEKCTVAVRQLIDNLRESGCKRVIIVPLRKWDDNYSWNDLMQEATDYTFIDTGYYKNQLEKLLNTYKGEAANKINYRVLATLLLDHLSHKNIKGVITVNNIVENTTKDVINLKFVRTLSELTDKIEFSNIHI